MALQEAVEEGEPVILEPVMRVEVVTPEDYVGAVQGNLAARRANITAMETRPGGIQALRAQVPLSEMFGYATDLRSMTQGRGTFTMEFEHYGVLPLALVERMLRGEVV
jgi:elongation factor G